MKLALGTVLGLAVLVMGGLYAYSEVGQEVVVLHRWSADGEPDRVRLWITDQGERSWLHHQTEEAAWIQRLRQDPLVTLERGGTARRYRGTPDAASHALVHQLTAEKYGSLTELLGSDPADCPAMPVRLDLIRD